MGEVLTDGFSDRGSTPLISTNAYYGNGLASHTVKSLVNMRVLGFLKQFGRFTPFLFSCLFCQLFANFSKISRAKFANFFKVWKAAARLGLRPFLRKILTSFYGLLPLNLPTFSHRHFIQATIQFFLHILGNMSVNG